MPTGVHHVPIPVAAHAVTRCAALPSFPALLSALTGVHDVCSHSCAQVAIREGVVGPSEVIDAVQALRKQVSHRVEQHAYVRCDLSAPVQDVSVVCSSQSGCGRQRAEGALPSLGVRSVS